MTNLKQLSTKPLPNKWVLAFLAVLSFASFLVSVYLTVEHFLGEIPTCTVLQGCEQVAKSKYSQIGPIPIALFGAGYFLTMFVLLAVYFDKKTLLALKAFVLFSVPGFLISLALLYLQFFVIGAVCIYCLVADISSILMFAGAAYLYFTVLRSNP
ncbi:MAG: vitamin K epoxide reductase family protein [Candidatus Spechtbacterales bacterium]